MKRALQAAFVIAMVLILSLTTFTISEYLLPSSGLRDLAVFYLTAAPDPQHPYTAASPAVVSAVLWDYRGVDTFYETMVFYLALVAGVIPLKALKTGRALERGRELSPIVKAAVRVVAPVVVTAGLAIGLHGSENPGGGFHGGATVAVAPLAVVAAFSAAFLLRRRVSVESLVFLASAGLVGIGATALSTFVAGLLAGANSYVFQNLPKPNAPAGFPGKAGWVPVDALLLFDVFELLTVACGFTLALMELMARRSYKGEAR